MHTRGQTGPAAKPRRRRGLRALMIAILALAASAGGWTIYAKLHQTRGVTVLWQQTYQRLESYTRQQEPQTMALMPSGGIAMVSTQDLMLRASSGTVKCSIAPPQDCSFSSSHAAQLIDADGNIYLSDRTTLHSYDAIGAKRWDVLIPPGPPGQERRYTTLNVAADGLLLTSSCSELIKFDFNGNLVFHKRSPSGLVFYELAQELPGGGYVISSKPPNDSPAAADPLYTFAAILDSDLNLVWNSSKLGDGVRTTIVNGNQIVMALDRSHVFTVDEQGQLLWEYNNPDPSMYNAPTVYYHLYPAGEGRTYIVSDTRAALVDAQGQVLWELTGQYFVGGAAAADGTQYLIQAEWSKEKYNAQAKWTLWLYEHIPKLYENLPDDSIACTLIRLEHGVAAQRWKLPDRSCELYGPDDDSVYYLFATGRKECSVYCVKLD